MAVEVSPQCPTSCSVPKYLSGLKGVNFSCHPEQVLPNPSLADLDACIQSKADA